MASIRKGNARRNHCATVHQSTLRARSSWGHRLLQLLLKRTLSKLLLLVLLQDSKVRYLRGIIDPMEAPHTAPLAPPGQPGE